MEFVVSDDKYKTVKDVLKKEFGFSKRLILKLKLEQRIYINNVVQFVNFNIKINDIIKIDLNFEEECDNIIATEMCLDIIYEDEWFIVLNKPAKIETHPTMANNINTLSNGVKFYFDSINLKRKIRPVNRLDKDTSGLIVFAKNQYVQEEFIKQMNNKTFSKIYIAIVDGTFLNTSKKSLEENSFGVCKGEIVANIARKDNSILERCIDNEKGVYAKTYYEVIKTLNNITVVKLKLDTR